MNATSIVTLAPSVLEARGNNGQELLATDYYDREHVTVETPQYVGMTAGHTVGVRWRGPAFIYDSPIRTVAFPARLAFQVPRWEVLDSIGTTVQVTFSVKRGAAAIEMSGALGLRVQGTPFAPPTYDAARAQVVVSYPSQANGQLVTVRWGGIVVRDTGLTTVVPGSPTRISIPSAWIQENRGRRVNVTYAIGTTSGAPYLFSRTLRLQL
ncbi:hypothetical protein [Pandoraea anhela]|uniref:Uncharacterized protein n=1 Tax=Pandoraea anhela TaxID=2508295 RepID=A0A5E4RNE4_9BURK|nr:hypothetical protein [Pandoraea anhela]VVD64847.1 hypothetical protein PAN31108_00300 [Pandoraea anhela]